MQPHPNGVLTIGLDADDTLWDNEDMFAAAEAEFHQAVAPWADSDSAQATLLQHERNTLSIYGYGVKGFVLSMITAATELSGGSIAASALAAMVELGNEILRAPVQLLDGVAATVAALAQEHQLLIITKGDPVHQWRKINESGLMQHMVGAEVVDEKDPDTYRSVLHRFGVEPERFIMVGNSVRSDIEPVAAIGARTIHIPYHVTWELETGTDDAGPPAATLTLNEFRELPSAINSLSNREESR